jgi:hypothetical protein
LIKEGENEGTEELRVIFHLNRPERGLNAVNGHSSPYELRITKLAYRNREKMFDTGCWQTSCQHPASTLCRHPYRTMNQYLRKKGAGVLSERENIVCIKLL